MLMVLLLGLLAGMFGAAALIDLSIRRSGLTPRDLLSSRAPFDRQRTSTAMTDWWDLSGGKDDASPSV